MAKDVHRILNDNNNNNNNIERKCGKWKRENVDKDQSAIETNPFDFLPYFQLCASRSGNIRTDYYRFNRWFGARRRRVQTVHPLSDIRMLRRCVD